MLALTTLCLALMVSVPTEGKCSLEALQCEPEAAPTMRNEPDFHEGDMSRYQEMVYSDRKAGNYKEALCYGHQLLDWFTFGNAIEGQLRYELAKSWRGLGCNAAACTELDQCLRVRPKTGRGYKVTCDTCKSWSCATCSTWCK